MNGGGVAHLAAFGARFPGYRLKRRGVTEYVREKRLLSRSFG